MRLLIALVFLVLAAPAFAQGWDRYENERFGFGVDVPPDFYVQDVSENGDGRSFALTGRPTFLVVWGGNLLNDFDTEVAQRMTWLADDAWNITYQAATPRWASVSGIKGSRVLYQRMVLLCDGQTYAAFQTEYSVVETAAMTPVIERLVASLRGDC